MRWAEIIGETDDVLADARAFILDMLAPLKAQGADSITVEQILDQLKHNPDFYGTALDSRFVMDALKNVEDLVIEPDAEAGGALTVKINNGDKSRQVDAEQAEKEKDDVHKAAQRSLDAQ
jgi:hypothetical protein